MKCPKCDYLGFETGDRCKNCGYDFSLIESSPADEVEIDLTPQLASDAVLDAPLHVPTPPVPPDPEPSFGRSQVVGPSSAARVRAEPSLPLFPLTGGDGDDEPLIKLPATPRPPLAVRRTPETPRLRAVPRPPPRIREEPALFSEEPPPAAVAPAVPAREISQGEISGGGARLAAAAIDHCLLLAIDIVVVYFTLRMAALPLEDWRLLPPAPLLAFLLLLKLSYFFAFTAVGGQTIGKMAARIRVVTDTGAMVDGTRAMTRTIAGVMSGLVLGLGFIPAVVGSDRRALHDRLARTRVIALRSA